MNNVERLKQIASNIGMISTEHNNIPNNISKMLDISKPNRPEIKEELQKQLESIS